MRDNNDLRMMKSDPSSRKLYIWTNQILYLGINPVTYREHTIVSDKLIVCLKGEMEITLESGEKVSSRSCLLGAGTNFKKSNININNAIIAIYFLAPITQDYHALKSIMSHAQNGVDYDHPEESQLIDKLIEIRNTPVNPQDAFKILRRFIVQPHLESTIFKEFDQRIIDVINKLRKTADENIVVKDFADDVYLSESRLEKLFKDQIGIPITKYRLKYRIFIGIIHLAQGYSITDSAMAAGFASASHFSKSFSGVNGIPPSETFLKAPYLEILLSEEIQNTINPTKQQSLDVCHVTPKIIKLSECNEYLLNT